MTKFHHLLSFKKMKKKGFTLPELLIVIAILSILSALATAHFLRATEKAKRSAAEAFMASLEVAINMYRIDTGHYPPDEGSSASLRRALNPDPEDPIYNDPEWAGPYLEFKDKEINILTGELLDPWHQGREDTVHVYVYRADLDGDPLTGPPFHNRSSYDIYCKGSDGKTGTDKTEANEFADGNYCQNGVDDDGDGYIDELSPHEAGAANGYLEDDVNNW